MAPTNINTDNRSLEAINHPIDITVITAIFIIIYLIIGLISWYTSGWVWVWKDQVARGVWPAAAGTEVNEATLQKVLPHYLGAGIVHIALWPLFKVFDGVGYLVTRLRGLRAKKPQDTSVCVQPSMSA
ncbi:hypothetical protein B0T20DRAFT_151527 [Sordaria brevicollis]|uniref:Uncharacterized protein n=1 Tax=Sordaria brevicollis TaxID=83679 RepID=A0AAE0PJ18_SORBR|nr:hypothetical protein B0T20DRAFT_151527 [Sordaria brevicollis]